MVNKVIVRITGGLGNQLFCYAAARRLALVNDAELVIDNVTGFIRDNQYRRQYELDHFNIPCRKATPAERLEPFERCRRGLMKWQSRSKCFEDRRYLVQEAIDFDERLLRKEVNGTIYIEGYWQSERYFKDVELTIRKDLQIAPPMDDMNQDLAEKITKKRSVALHVRWFESKETNGTLYNVPWDYYQHAIKLIESKVASPHYFIFSDNTEAASAKLNLPEGHATVVSHNDGVENAYADLWLMTKCRHFITANSTFSWWGAWLGGGQEKIVVTPKFTVYGEVSAWGFNGLIPDNWLGV